MQKNKLLIVLGCLTLLLWGLYLNRDQRNIHLVGTQPNIYRSAQLSKQDLAKLIKDKNIQVILNLRGKIPDALWYQDEISLCKDLGLEHYDIGLSNSEAPSRQSLLSILDLLDQIKLKNQNLLIHCRAGSDRTGLVSSMARLYVYGDSSREARAKGFTWLYGHLPDPGSALELILNNYAKQEGALNLREWLSQKYNKKAIMAESQKMPHWPH